MRRHKDHLLHSASDLNAFLGCSHAAALNLRKLVDPGCLPERAVDDEGLGLIQEAGHSHEADYLARLKEAGADVAEISGSGSLEERAAATLSAMQQGREIIYQATFLAPPWHGFADFLRRVEVPSAVGPWSYEPIDTKLARTADPKHVLQLGLYADLMADVQQVAPHSLHLVLGDGREESFRRIEFHHTLAAAKERYLEFVGSGAEGSVGEPCSTCQFCGWRDHCSEIWEEEDHLSLVAGIAKGQIDKLRKAGIFTVVALADAPPGSRVPKLSQETFERLRAQAVLQVARRSGEPSVEHLPLEPVRGFQRLPAPHPADLFFDLEGDPLFPGGLEYLWGVHYRSQGEARFIAEWAHDRAAEQAVFEKIVDFFTDHLRAHPGAHIYHYAAYEVTVLRRLSTAFASREEAVDDLLRAEKFVDLYTVARKAIRTSEPSLSLKALEIFFAQSRGEAVTKADQSIVHYHRWRETGDQSYLDGILAYNKVDCENTEGLRDWLLGIRPQEAQWWTKPPATENEQTEEQSAEAERLEQLRQLVRTNALRLSDRARELLAHLIDFHWRAKKPELWAIFDRCERMEDELLDDGECIGDIRPARADWLRPDKRSTIATYSFPHQDTKLREGKDVLHAPTRTKLGKIDSLDLENGIVEVRRGNKSGLDWPTNGSIMPNWPIDDTVLRTAVIRVAEALAAGSDAGASMEEGQIKLRAPYQALVDLIERSPPRFHKWRERELVRESEDLVDAATARALDLDDSTLFIQGPPGTGKTYTSAHVIIALLQAGKRVGVSSNSHAAINNLLRKVEDIALKEGVSVNGAKKVSRADEGSYLNGSMIVDVDRAADVLEGGYQLVGGTAWLFAMEEFDGYFDHLFVDEAGQVSLGHMVAMGAAAKNIILVGDQMQLGQPIQGSHPGESGLSVLDYLLQGAATIAPDRGILLDTSWRMHPSICSFISDAVYDGRLQAHPDNQQQKLLLDGGVHPALKAHGIRMIEMSHSGCGQRSEEEATIAAQLVTSLVGQSFVDRNGRQAVLGLDNILVVAPYNMQVNELKVRLPNGTRVGTVDKFQGQEAEVVIVSLATSSPEDLPRHVDFFYSKNRLNVAISRARTLAIVLANPKLLELDAKSVEHLRLVNTLAWLTAEARGDLHAC